MYQLAHRGLSQYYPENAMLAFPHADVRTFCAAESAMAFAENNGCDVLSKSEHYFCYRLLGK